MSYSLMCYCLKCQLWLVCMFVYNENTFDEIMFVICVVGGVRCATGEEEGVRCDGEEEEVMWLCVSRNDRIHHLLDVIVLSDDCGLQRTNLLSLLQNVQFYFLQLGFEWC